MKSHEGTRINIFFGIIILIASLISYRLFILSYVRHYSYSMTAEAQSDKISNILARGNIYILDPKATVDESKSNLFLAATNKKFPLVYIVPTSVPIDKATELSEKLSTIIKVDKDEILKVINSKSNNSKVIKRKLETSQVNDIKNINIDGVGISYEIDRFYPNDELASDILGFLGYNGSDRVGQYGIEAFYDSALFGRSENSSNIVDTSKIKNFWSNLFSKKNNSSTNSANINKPSDIVTTIDRNIQFFIENKLEELLKKWNAEKGLIIVQDPITGKIIAMADRPSFNPNDYGGYSPNIFLNSSVQEQFEPGSSFKPITMAAGLDLAKVTPTTTYTDTGVVEVAGKKIQNFDEQAHGVMTMTQVLEKSLNTGAIFVENTIGDDNFLNYVINMGFGQKTGIDLPGEINGDITNLYSGRKINFLTASFGQGIAVTPLQLINAYSAIANGGKLMRPYIVEKIIKGNGEEVVTNPEVVTIPISEKTSTKLKTMLVNVVDRGFDKARITGYDVAGKTGTAQIPDGKGGYLENEFIHDFLGFAPAYNPKFVVLVRMDKPQGIKFAADSLSPTFREIASFLLNYYNIPPTR